MMTSSYPNLVLGFCKHDDILAEATSRELEASLLLLLEKLGIGGGRVGEGLDSIL